MEAQQCRQCGKMMFRNRNQAKRAATHLKHSEANEHRAFVVAQCTCRGAPIIVATRPKHADHQREKRMRDKLTQSIKDEEDSTIRAIVDDATTFMTHPESHRRWLVNVYGDTTATRIIAEAKRIIKENAK